MDAYFGFEEWLAVLQSLPAGTENNIKVCVPGDPRLFARGHLGIPA